MILSAHVPLPQIATDADGTLRSTQFGDVYAARAGATAQAEYVFIGGNNLPQRFAHTPYLTIAELGFGTGTNFLTTCQVFDAVAPADHRLDYLAFEQYPFTAAQLRELLPASARVEALLADYPLRVPGFHRIALGRITLLLIFGDARAHLETLPPRSVDAWYLDGFAPGKNPELWGTALMQAVARSTRDGGTVATYSASSSVREALIEAGFDVTKRQGFAGKKSMLCGRLSAPTQAYARALPASVAVVGGGVAGCSMAYALAERGVEVTLLEQRQLASGGSGNVAAALYPQITKHWIAASWWHLTAYAHALRYYRHRCAQGLAFDFTSPGMAKLAMTPEEALRLRGVNDALGLDPTLARWCEATELAALTGLPLDFGGVWFGQGSLLSPKKLCAALATHPRIAVREGCGLEAIRRHASHWHLTTSTGDTLKASHVVLAAAQEAKRFVPWLRLNPTAGQVTEIAADPALAPLRYVLCHTVYVVPFGEGYVLGATYDRTDLSETVTPANHEKNIRALHEALPGWASAPHVRDGRTSLRASTADRIPYIGVVDEGLYVSAGFGSRGMVSAPLAADVLAAELLGEPIPLSAELRAAVAPQRHRPQGNASA